MSNILSHSAAPKPILQIDVPMLIDGLLQECDCSRCSLVNSAVYQKMERLVSLAGGQKPPNCFAVVCCCGGERASGAHARPRSGARGCPSLSSSSAAVECEADGRAGAVQCCADHSGNPPQLQPRQTEGQPGGASDEMVLETGSSGLWAGVSGVPGLGVSIPRPASSCLDSEWDRHEPGRNAATPAGSRNIPRPALSPRSSSCRSSGRSTGSRGSSALSAGLSGGSSASSEQSRGNYSSRSDSAFSVPRVKSPLRGDTAATVSQG